MEILLDVSFLREFSSKYDRTTSIAVPMLISHKLCYELTT